MKFFFVDTFLNTMQYYHFNSECALREGVYSLGHSEDMTRCRLIYSWI